MNCNDDKKILKKAIQKIEYDQQFKPSCSCVIGPTGPTGPRGENIACVNVLGSYNDYDTFIKEHPTGNVNDSYLVNGDIYVWDNENKKWVNAGTIQGPKGEQGEIGPTGPTGPDGPEKIKHAYLVTFNDGSSEDGIPVNSEDRLPINRKELDIYNLITLDSNEQTIKFNLVGYYKISFIISARVLKTDTVFDPKEDFISIGLRLENTDNIYIGNSEWIYNEGYIQLKAHGILAVDNPDNTYELINVGPKTIYLNTPDINYIKSSSYFTNSLVSIMVEYLGK